MHVVVEEGGLIRTPRDKDTRRRFRPERRETRNAFKTGADLAAERRTAQQRWAGVPPLVTVREKIAELDLAPELLGQVLEVVTMMPEEQLAELVNSGELFRQLAELAVN